MFKPLSGGPVSEPVKKYNAAQVRLLQVIELLSGHEVGGMRLKHIHAALADMGCQVTNSTVLHDLEALQKGGWASQDVNDLWRLAAKPFQLLANLQYGLSDASRKLAEKQHNYTRLTA